MPICVGVPKEIEQGEHRVALVPTVAERFKKMGVEVLLESGAGTESYYPDKAYDSATIVNSAGELYQRSDLILKIQPPTEAEIEQMKEGAVVAGMMLPYRYPERVKKMRDRGILSFAMELVPRISRAQGMDVLSSQASIAGYKAVLIAANRFGGFFPMLTTAAGTIRPAKVLVIGAGVAVMMAYAEKVIIVPGYGMAVAQAQHKVWEFARFHEERDVKVKFAIHPVAGRMPGHMNVLLAEAGVPYDKIYDLDEINNEFPQADVALVIGANDVVNPVARSNPDSPIYGMPILDADKARNVICVKRGKGKGFSGVENALFFLDNTRMLYGDGQEVAGKLIAELKQL